MLCTLQTIDAVGLYCADLASLTLFVDRVSDVASLPLYVYTVADLASLTHVGVEHLLRDVKDSTVSNLSSEVSHMASGLRALKSRLSEVQEYLNLVLEGRLPVNHDIMYHLQVRYKRVTGHPLTWNLLMQSGTCTNGKLVCKVPICKAQPCALHTNTLLPCMQLCKQA